MSTLQPDYYRIGGVDVIEFCQRQGLSFTLGNVVKYVTRAGRKNADTDIEDLQKAREYIDREIEARKKAKEELREKLDVIFEKNPNSGSGGNGGVGGGFGVISYGGINKAPAPIKAVPVEELEATAAEKSITRLEALDRKRKERGEQGTAYTFELAAHECPDDYGLADPHEVYSCDGDCVSCWLKEYKE